MSDLDSMQKIQVITGEPLSLPENRTEDEHFGLLHWLELTAQTETHCIGKQMGADGIEHEVWQHTMTPLPASPDRWNEADPFFDNPRTNRILARMADQSVKHHRQEERARKRTKRHRRAAQRWHYRGR